MAKEKNINQLQIKIDKELLIYSTPDGSVKVEVLLQDENLWLRQDKMAELFGVDRSVVTKHLKNIFESGEIVKESNVQKLHITNSDKPVKFYNLDTIISVGYRVNSHRATMFRVWATERLKEYIIKGFTMNDERLKNPTYAFGQDYFDEQLERIRDIRISERRMYQKITDVYIQCSADYRIDANETELFFKTAQNKLHHAITGQTAAEIICSRANAECDNMGLTTWKNAPKGLIRKSDVAVAKNYLSQSEMEDLRLIVGMYLDYAESQARNRQVMYMTDWIKKLDAFLKFNEKDVLGNAGSISTELAKEHAEAQFEIYNLKQLKDYESDFDNLIKQYKKTKPKK